MAQLEVINWKALRRLDFKESGGSRIRRLSHFSGCKTSSLVRGPSRIVDGRAEPPPTTAFHRAITGHSKDRPYFPSLRRVEKIAGEYGEYYEYVPPQVRN